MASARYVLCERCSSHLHVSVEQQGVSVMLTREHVFMLCVPFLSLPLSFDCEEWPASATRYYTSPGQARTLSWSSWVTATDIRGDSGTRCLREVLELSESLGALKCRCRGFVALRGQRGATVNAEVVSVDSLESIRRDTFSLGYLRLATLI